MKILAVCMIFLISACGGEKSTPTAPSEADNASVENQASRDNASFGIDYTQKGEQPMAQAEASVEVLKKTAEEYLDGTTMFKYSDDVRMYGDFANYIGCEATVYQYKAKQNERTYIWKATDSSTVWFAITFGEEIGTWKLYAASSANLGLSANK